jgi:GR25 family glycosyltransferase involved in LPS biosynthesis
MKAFIIHLSKIQNSLTSAQKLQQDLKSINIDAELFEGTYGNDAVDIFKKENRSVHPINFKGVDTLPEEAGKMQKPGVMGCFYSHYRLWKKCVKLNETICIFEDDVNIVRPLVEVEFEEVLVLALGATKRRKYEEWYLKNPTGDPRAERYTNGSMPGTPGYMITPEAAKKLVKTYKNTYLPSDNAMNQTVIKIQIHSHLIGEANLDKNSLTKTTKFWSNFKNE